MQRCGEEVNGGAEFHCLQVAQKMARHWHTEVLTTCALDYMTWENYYPEGAEQLGPTVVRRFPTDEPRDVEAFNRLSREIHPRRLEAPLAEQERWMRAQGPLSTRFLEYLRTNQDSYDAFIFFGYLYATTYFGLPLVSSKAYLAPLAHDEWTISLAMWDKLFSKAEGFIFNTEAERQFLQGRFPNANLTGPVIGVGIEPPDDVYAGAAAFRARYNLNVPFLLYVGRIDESKGCAEMIDYFLRWMGASRRSHKLVLLGSEVMPVPFHDNVVYLGFVPPEEKWAAMNCCDWLIVPSLYESLSMSLLEAWSVGRPALVNAKCAVLVEHCRKAHGGLWYDNFQEWSAALSFVDATTKRILGRQGKSYVRQNYSWDRIEDTYLNLLSKKTRDEDETK